MNRKSIIWISVACAGSLICAMPGCGGYGKVSDRTYQMGQALYSICNTESSARLERIRKLLEEQEPGSAMSAQEHKWLEDIIEQAEAGHWQTAAARARQLMEDQVSY